MKRRGRIAPLITAALMALLLAAPIHAQEYFTADAARLVKALQLRPGQTIADIGAGAGEISIILARELGPSSRVYATELSATLLGRIRRSADSTGLKNVTVVEAHATRTNLPDACCDALIVRNVYHHFTDTRQMNASMRQALKPGGLLAIIDFAPEGAESADPAGRATATSHGVTQATVARELREAGFDVVAEEPRVGNRGYMVVVRRPSVATRESVTSTGEPPALDAITVDDIRRDLFALAGDEMRGREAGTLDELRASAWVAERARAAGLEPAGDDGTYFQFWPMRRTVTSLSSSVRVGNRQLRLGTDAYVVTPINANVGGPVVWLDSGRDTTRLRQSVEGKIVAFDLTAPATLPAPGMSLWAGRYTIAAINDAVRALAAKRVAAILLVADSIAEGEIGGFWGQVLARGRYGIDSAAVAPPSVNVPVVWLSRAYRNDLRAASPTVSIAVDFDSYVYPSVNVVARVRGTDATLRDEYVLFSAHQDHDGVRAPVRGDSIYNGADDNATVSVAILAIGRALARQPGRRSALFVWHGAEERGLLGSRWHAWHPVVPRDQIVAVLNADMIGNNHPDSAGLLGVQPPHLNSRDLARMALEANARVSRFAIDSTWDRPSHPEFWYFRSDHVPYARYGIPSVYFSTLPHRLYHTPADDPASINVEKVTRVARWMYATGWAAAIADRRPDRVEGFKLER